MPGIGTFAHTTTVDGLFSTMAHFETPPYQREHVWEARHWKGLWDDLMAICDRPNELHFIGVVTLTKSPLPGPFTYLIVDGQQRLTTLSLLLCAVRDMIAKSDESLARDFHPSVWNSEFNVPRLVPRYRDSHIYRDIARQEPVRGGASPMLKAYRYFMRELKGMSDRTPEAIGRALLSKLQIVWVVLDQNEATTRVFEDLNDKRVALSQSDLIRNHVFTQEPAETQDQFDRDHWQFIEEGFTKDKSTSLDIRMFDAFFQHLLTCERQVNIPTTQIYRRFRDDAIGKGTATHITDRLRPRKERYLLVRGLRTPTDSTLADALDRVRRPGVAGAFPVALAVLDAFAEGEGGLTADQRDRVLDMLASFLVRGHLCGRDSRRQWRILPGLCDLGHGDEATSTVAWIRGKLVASDWPDDDEFLRDFVQHSFSKRSFEDAVVRGLERARQAADGYAVHDEAPGIHVEHVLPKAIADATDANCLAWQEALGEEWHQVHARWVLTPGNLALLTGKVNAALGNAPYKEKRKFLMKAKTCLNTDFEDYDRWSAAEIEDRGTRLAHEALAVWKGPDHTDWR